MVMVPRRGVSYMGYLLGSVVTLVVVSSLLVYVLLKNLLGMSAAWGASSLILMGLLFGNLLDSVGVEKERLLNASRTDIPPTDRGAPSLAVRPTAGRSYRIESDIGTVAEAASSAAD